VAFAEATEDIDDAYTSSPKLGAQNLSAAGNSGNNGGGSKASKWQPLSPVEPNPIADNDPFSLGDSEDEKDVKDKVSKDGKGDDDAERLRKAAAEAMNDSLVESKPKDGPTS
jgi:hypothetical protein